jgi:hypothetical protein
MLLSHVYDKPTPTLVMAFIDSVLMALVSDILVLLTAISNNGKQEFVVGRRIRGSKVVQVMCSHRSDCVYFLS